MINSLVNKSLETKINDFNKMFIDTEELQSEITKLKNSVIKSFIDKGTADITTVKTDISNIKSDLANVKSSNDKTSKSLKGINLKISDFYAKESSEISDKVVELETRINTNNTQRISKDENQRIKRRD